MATGVSTVKDDPRYTPRAGEGPKRGVSITPIPTIGAVHDHQTEFHGVVFGSSPSLVAPKVDPITLTFVPVKMMRSAKLSFAGALLTIKVALVAVPPGFIMRMGPVVAPGGTVVVIC